MLRHRITTTKINLVEKFNLLHEPWRPKIIASRDDLAGQLTILDRAK